MAAAGQLFCTEPSKRGWESFVPYGVLVMLVGAGLFVTFPGQYLLAASSVLVGFVLLFGNLGAVVTALKAVGDTNKALIHNRHFDNPAVMDVIASKVRCDA